MGAECHRTHEPPLVTLHLHVRVLEQLQAPTPYYELRDAVLNSPAVNEAIGYVKPTLRQTVSEKAMKKLNKSRYVAYAINQASQPATERVTDLAIYCDGIWRGYRHTWYGSLHRTVRHDVVRRRPSESLREWLRTRAPASCACSASA